MQIVTYLEFDETSRLETRALYAWDRVGAVRPSGAMERKIVEGVY